MLKQKYYSLLLLSVLVICSGLVNAAPLRKGPYLMYDGEPTRMNVLWQLDGAAGCTIEWGDSVTYPIGSDTTIEYGGDHQHIYTITGLTPGMKYDYSVNAGSYGVHTGSFTAGPADSEENVKLLVYGDTRTYPARHDAVCAGMVNTYTADEAYQTIALHVADWVNSGDNESDWTSQFFGTTRANTRQFQADVPISGCIGNHEQSGAVFEKYFPFPYATANDFYWSFDYGPVHVLMVDQYTSYSSGSTQYNWCLNDLVSSPKPWKFIVFHQPAWTGTGSHGNDMTARAFVEDLVADGAAIDIVLAGHNHFYTRCLVGGIQHIVTGGGGAPLAGTGSEPSGTDYYTAEVTNQFCEIEIQGATLTFNAIRVYTDDGATTTTPATDGHIFDSFVISRETDPPTPDPAAFDVAPWAVSSVEVTMTAAIGTDASGPVEYYFAETSGNPGGSDSGWTTNPVYSDTGLEPDTQYIYTVQMSDAVGNIGTVSEPANVTTTPVENDPPTPDPAAFGSAPAAVSSSEITMTATLGSDATGPVEYYFAEISGNPGADNSGWTTNPSYTDSGLDPLTQYTYTVQMSDALGNTGTVSESASATTLDTAPADDVANADIAVSGTVTGSYANTQTSNNITQQITERQSGGKPSNRYSILEHKWTINVTGGDSVTFFVEAYKTVSSDGDDFVFEYSTDDSAYINMVAVTDTTETLQSYPLPAATSGTVYIRVIDTNHTPGNNSLDSIYVDYLCIRSAGPATPDTDPPTPDPMTWATIPYATGGSTIYMAASTATDSGGVVQYYFTCTSGTGHDSGWQTSTTYSDTGLFENTIYTYTVKACDSSGNETSDSTAATATTGLLSVPGEATDPSPSDAQVRVNNKSVILSWIAGTDATSHDVYFGTSDTLGGAGESKGNQTGTSYTPGTLARKTIYFWRIDEVNTAGKTAGTVWSFETK